MMPIHAFCASSLLVEHCPLGQMQMAVLWVELNGVQDLRVEQHNLEV